MVRRQSLQVTLDGLTRTSHFDGRPIPLVIEPTMPEIDIVTWVEHRAPYLDGLIARHGAVLLRNFNILSTEIFQTAMVTGFGPLINYMERSSPRTRVSGMVFSSTDYPADRSIFLHNEQSYNLRFPSRIAFFCEQPAKAGGETPIADTRKVLRRLRSATRERFLRTGYQLVRNYGSGFGLTWQEAFQAENPGEVNAYCREHDIDVLWRGDELETRQHRPTIAKHPVTGAMSWFNHLTFFHRSTLEPSVSRELDMLASEDRFPNHTFNDDGSPIEAEVVQELRDAYLAEQITFEWRQGDLLLLDNMLVAHGRGPFKGPRQVRVAMARPYKWVDVQVRDVSELAGALA